MNSEQALNQVEAAITKRPPSTSGYWNLTFFDNMFRLWPTGSKPSPWPVIVRLSQREIVDGLQNATWTTIKNRIAKLIAIGGQI